MIPERYESAWLGKAPGSDRQAESSHREALSQNGGETLQAG